MLRSIVLPRQVTSAIEQKLSAEQESQRMEFVIRKELQEAERCARCCIGNSLGMEPLSVMRAFTCTCHARKDTARSADGQAHNHIWKGCGTCPIMFRLSLLCLLYRKRIEATGIQEFQTIVAKGISKQMLEWKGIEATEKLAMSDNAKVVVIGNSNGLPLIFDSGSQDKGSK